MCCGAYCLGNTLLWLENIQIKLIENYQLSIFVNVHADAVQILKTLGQSSEPLLAFEIAD